MHRRLGSGLLATAIVCTLMTGPVPARAVAPEGAGLAPTAVEVRDGGGRSSDLDRGWRFALVNRTGVTDPTGAFAGAPDPGFDDSTWRVVDLPHDWSIELDPTSGAGTGTSAGTGFLQGGLGWYRKTFTLPPSLTDRRISVEFDGVYMDSSVYFNGQLVGAHPYGYTGFSVDLTPLARTDGATANVLAVKVQNQIPSSRWYSGSGIYRNVRLVVTDPVHVTRHGTFVTTPDLEGTIGSGFATVRAQTSLVDEGGGSRQVDVVSTVEDADGRVVGRQRSSVTADAEVRTDTVDVRVDHPTLWSIERPYLYTLVTDLVVDGRVADTTTTRFGIRWFRIDPDEGFSLNGRHTKIYGVDLHHDLGALGAAVSRDALVRQMRLMKSMGVNAFRTSHNPPSPEMIQVCEELGIVMMVEAFDTWRTPKVPFDYGRFFDANSDADIQEMVHTAKNSPAVILWSIGNEIPDSTSVTVGLPIARRLIDDIRAIDTTRPVVIGSDKYRSVPSAGSGADQILGLLDGLGLNYNTAASVDALHARYPGKFLFESESSSETSSRGVYQEPQLLNTGENYTPGRRATSSYDNNLASWTMSGEYGLKKDRDRRYFLGQFLWSGIDYLGEPTPYDNLFPVKSSFFGAVDTAGLPKDTYYLFKSQWTTEPMVHLLPMNWTDHERGEPVEVWAYANVDTVELFLNGRSLGVRRFDHKTTTDGRPYLETTEPTGDDKTVTGGPFPGSYTSPNGSAGKLHLSWSVPFAPGKLVAVARRNGVEVARDQLQTAAAPRMLELTPDRKVIAADGRSLSFVTVDVVDPHGVTVPGADNPVSFEVSGGALVGLDNGRQESAENYKASSRSAFNGKALAIVRSSQTAGPITVTARSPGLAPAKATIWSTGADGRGPAAPEPASLRIELDDPAAPATASTPAVPPTADASYSGSRAAVPAVMLDGVTATGGWSNFYSKAATALLPVISQARPRDWVSLEWPVPQRTALVRAWFTTGATRALPATLQVTQWTGTRFVAVRNLHIDWATASNQPTTITFDQVRTSELRLEMTSPSPGSTTGFLQIAELEVSAGQLGDSQR